MISRDVAIRLIDHISNSTQTISNIYTQFSNDFSFPEKVSSLMNLSYLLSEAFLSHQQQIAAAWILYSQFSSNSIDQNPFFATFQFINNNYFKNPNQFCPSLCSIISLILNNEPLDFLSKLTVPQIMDFNFSKIQSNRQTENEKKDDLSSKTEKQSTADANAKNNTKSESNFCEKFFCPIVITEEVENEESDMTNDEVLIELMTNGLITASFEPIYLRDPPEVTSVLKGEPQFLFGDFPPFIIDESVTTDTREWSFQLLKKSIKEKLTPDETSTVVEGLKKFKSLIESTSFSQRELAEMININPEVAKNYIAAAIGQRNDLREFLIGLDVNLPSVEIIKHLISLKKVDEEFVNNYITHSMLAIQPLEDDNLRNMKVMLFCRFMPFIIKEIKICQDVKFELISFSFGFSQEIEEAKDLLIALRNS